MDARCYWHNIILLSYPFLMFNILSLLYYLIYTVYIPTNQYYCVDKNNSNNVTIVEAIN